MLVGLVLFFILYERKQRPGSFPVAKWWGRGRTGLALTLSFLAHWVVSPLGQREPEGKRPGMHV